MDKIDELHYDIKLCLSALRNLLADPKQNKNGDNDYLISRIDKRR